MYIIGVRVLGSIEYFKSCQVLSEMEGIKFTVSYIGMGLTHAATGRECYVSYFPSDRTGDISNKGIHSITF